MSESWSLHSEGFDSRRVFFFVYNCRWSIDIDIRLIDFRVCECLSAGCIPLTFQHGERKYHCSALRVSGLCKVTWIFCFFFFWFLPPSPSFWVHVCDSFLPLLVSVAFRASTPSGSTPVAWDAMCECAANVGGGGVRLSSCQDRLRSIS